MEGLVLRVLRRKNLMMKLYRLDPAGLVVEDHMGERVAVTRCAELHRQWLLLGL